MAKKRKSRQSNKRTAKKLRRQEMISRRVAYSNGQQDYIQLAELFPSRIFERFLRVLDLSRLEKSATDEYYYREGFNDAIEGRDRVNARGGIFVLEGEEDDS